MYSNLLSMWCNALHFFIPVRHFISLYICAIISCILFVTWVLHNVHQLCNIMHFVHCVAFQAQTIALFFWLPVVQTPDVNQALPSVKVFVWSIPILFVSILIHRSEHLQLQLQQLLSSVLCVIFSSAPFFKTSGRFGQELVRPPDRP